MTVVLITIANNNMENRTRYVGGGGLMLWGTLASDRGYIEAIMVSTHLCFDVGVSLMQMPLIPDALWTTILEFSVIRYGLFLLLLVTVFTDDCSFDYRTRVDF